MNILHITHKMDPLMGGVSQAVRTMVSGLIAENFHNEVLSLDDPGSLTDEGLIIHTMGPAKGFWAYNKNLSVWLNKNIARFDVVIVHGLWLYYGYAVRKAFAHHQHNGLRLYVMPHGMLDPYFQHAPGRKLKAVRNNIYWSLIERHLISNANGLLFTCEEEMLLARQTFNGYRPNKELVIGLGVDEPPVYHPAMGESFFTSCPQLKQKKYLLFLSRLHEKKGVELAILAYVKYYSGHLEKDAASIPMLVLAGPGLDTEYGKHMQCLAAETALAEYIIFPGMLSGNAKWGAFYHCEAFLLPSHQENFGIAIVEALACGKPVMITKQVNIWREIEREQVGIITSDDLVGVMEMMHWFNSLSTSHKKMLEETCINAYQRNFSTSHAAMNLVKSIGAAPENARQRTNII